MMDRQAAIEYVRKLSPVDPNDPCIHQLQQCEYCNQAGTADRPLLLDEMDCDDGRSYIPVAVHGDCHIAAQIGAHEGLCAFVADQEPTPRTRELRARFKEDPSARATLEKFGREISNVKRPGGTNHESD